MFGGLEFSQLCVLFSVHGCGLISAALSRIAEGGRWQSLFQRLFVGLLVVVALTTVLSMWNSPQQGVFSAATLTVMIVTATCDFAHPL
jgi:hypothetical protein